MYINNSIVCDTCSDNLIDKDYLTNISSNVKHFCNLNCKLNFTEMEKLKLDIFEVGSKFRTNSLSTIEGGTTVVVIYKNGRKLLYNNIKDISAYINKTLKNPLVASAYEFTDK